MDAPRIYRVYRLDGRGKLAAGEWLTASDDDEAREAALRLCDGAAPAVEIWEGRRLVGVVACPKAGAGASKRPSLGP